MRGSVGLGCAGRRWRRLLIGLAVPAAVVPSLVAPDLAAQHPAAPVGVQLGYSNADFGGRDGSTVGSREGALAGVYLTKRLTPGFAIQPEILFALKGGRTTATVQGGTAPIPIDMELAYFEFPVLAKFAPLADRHRLHPVVFGGMTPAIRIGCDFVPTTAESTDLTSCDSLPSLSFKSVDVGVVLGGGVQLDWTESALALEVRYTVGLLSVLGSTADVRNRQWGIMLALNF